MGNIASGQATNEYAPWATFMQELERIQFSANMKSNPAEYNTYITTRINQMTDEIFNRKRTAFQKAQIDLGRYMDMDHNANFYKNRTGDVDRLTAEMDSKNNFQYDAVKRDKDITKRQFEINEWYNYNKLETLFFLQLFFIATLVMVILIYLQKTGFITNRFATFTTAILVLIVGITGIYRYRYTQSTRDPRLWHRRKFDSVAADSSPPLKCDPSGTVVVDLNAVVPKNLTSCVDDATSRFNDWQKSLKEEMKAYQTAGTVPASLSGDQQTVGGRICENLNTN